jgi:hypothetical protein
MQTDMAEGRRVRVRPSGETGRIVRVVRAADGRTTYEVAFDSAIESSAGNDGESGGLYVAEDIEPAD